MALRSAPFKTKQHFLTERIFRVAAKPLTTRVRKSASIIFERSFVKSPEYPYAVIDAYGDKERSSKYLL